VPGKGSTFTFYIILDEEIDISGLTGKHAKALEGARILVVDDRPEMRLQISDLLFKWKCIPQAVSSAEEALQYLQYGMEFKLALVDICMPNMSGVELAQELRRKYPNIPLIGISSVELSSGEEYFDHYMYKPIDQNVLFPAVLQCLEAPSRDGASPRKRKLKLRSRLKILVAEDDPRNAYTMREMLMNLGFKGKEHLLCQERRRMCSLHARSRGRCSADGHCDADYGWSASFTTHQASTRPAYDHRCQCGGTTLRQSEMSKRRNRWLSCQTVTSREARCCY